MRALWFLALLAVAESTPPTTASPTAAPTGAPGRCCGKNSETGENFCIITDADDCEGGRRGLSDFFESYIDTLNRRAGSLGGNWTENESCNVSNPCNNGVLVSSNGASFSLDASNAGLGANGGVSLTPSTAAKLPAGSAAKLPNPLLLAFEVTRYDGGNVVPSDFLPDGFYITVKIQPTNPEIVDANAFQVLRWDEVNDAWVDIQEECKTKIASTDFVLDTATDPNTLSVFLCHTSSFAMTANTDGQDEKPGKKAKLSTKPVTKPGKKDKVPTKAKADKPGKVATANKPGKKEAAKADPKADGGKKESVKGKKVGIAVGAAAGVAVGLGVAAMVVVKYRRNAKKPKKANKKARKTETAEVPIGWVKV